MKILSILIINLAFISAVSAKPDAASDQRTIAALDKEYQLAVKNNDAETMDRILSDDFFLVLGNGTTYNKADLLKQARERSITWERQEDSNQTVRVWGDTAIVTALLSLKYVYQGKTYERQLWFSDTYVRTSKGWKYIFGQASLSLPG